MNGSPPARALLPASASREPPAPSPAVTAASFCIGEFTLTRAPPWRRDIGCSLQCCLHAASLLDRNLLQISGWAPVLWGLDFPFCPKDTEQVKRLCQSTERYERQRRNRLDFPFCPKDTEQVKRLCQLGLD